MALNLTDPSVGLNAATGGTLTGWNHVVQSLQDIFHTQFGSRVMREWYGSFVPALLGNLITPAEVTPFFAAITSAIEQWEPRFRVTQIQDRQGHPGRAAPLLPRRRIPTPGDARGLHAGPGAARGCVREPGRHPHRAEAIVMSRFTAIDLSGLTPPDIIETVDFETIVKAMRDDLVARFPAIENVIDLESEPARKLIEAFAYRETLLRARINDGVSRRPPRLVLRDEP